jgi:hypothetical protein
MKNEGSEIKEKVTHQESQNNRSSSDIVGALLLIFVGVLFLANNLGIISWSVWNDLWKFWPILLILLGMQFLIGKSTFAQIIMAVITISLLTLGFLYIAAGSGILKGTVFEYLNNGRTLVTPANNETGYDSDNKDSDETNRQIIRDIKSEGIDCDLNNYDGKIIKDQCTVDKVVANFAIGKMPQAYWIAVKQNKKWKAVVTGNGIPSCKEIDNYSIPKEIFGNCIENSGELRY